MKSSQLSLLGMSVTFLLLALEMIQWAISVCFDTLQCICQQCLQYFILLSRSPFRVQLLALAFALTSLLLLHAEGATATILVSLLSCVSTCFLQWAFVVYSFVAI